MQSELPVKGNALNCGGYKVPKHRHSRVGDLCIEMFRQFVI